jgi:5-methylcytosine-specific restriction endonuclease McrA
MPTCTVCKKDLSVDKFPRNGYDKDGAIRRRPDCAVCYGIRRKTNSKKGKSSYGKFVNNMLHRTGEIVDLTLDEWRSCLVHFEGCCAYCGKKQSRSIRLTKDHLVPCVEGGRTTKWNVVPACTVCNCSKGGTDLARWYKKQTFYSGARYERIITWTMMS